LEATDDVLVVQAGRALRLALDERASRFRARQVEDVESAGPLLSIVRECGTAGSHAARESVHVGPVFLVERGIVFDARCTGSGTAVDEEVDGVECTATSSWDGNPFES